MAKSNREKIKLVSSAGTGHYYTAAKNKKLHPEKLQTKKYDPTIRKHVIYKESKIKSIRRSGTIATRLPAKWAMSLPQP